MQDAEEECGMRNFDPMLPDAECRRGIRDAGQAVEM
jgi:hypothetical protein